MRVLVAVLFLVVACGDDSTSADAGTDASSDSSSDAVVDTNEPDAADAEVADAQDATVDSAPPEECSEDGAMRVAPCGNCGMGQEICTDGFWVLSACLGEGECSPGTLEREPLPMCGERGRLCSDMCSWLDWEELSPPEGECVIGETRTDASDCADGLVRPQQCDDSCAWVDSGACMGPCGDLRSTPFDAQEVCIPEGDYQRGGDAGWEATRVFVSTFTIDRFPVTFRRYRACRDAGVCTSELEPLHEARVFDDDYLDWMAAGADHFQAQEFCAWDGGRRLPTEAEWEKSMRGPWPRSNPWTWDGDAYRCELFFANGCPGTAPPSSLDWIKPINQDPGSQSFYGVDDPFFHGEWMADWYSDTYYEDPTTNVDPAGPATGDGRVWKNYPILPAPPDPEELVLSLRRSKDPTNGSTHITFRCARDIEL